MPPRVKYTTETLKEKIRSIYSTEGIEGLIPKYLNDRHRNLHDVHVRKVWGEATCETVKVGAGSQKGNIGAKGCPSYRCCEAIGVLSERTKYLDYNIVSMMSKERLLEFMTPSVEEKRKVCSFLEPTDFQHSVGNRWRALGLVFDNIREHFGYSVNRVLANNGFLCESKGEANLVNYLTMHDVEILAEHPKYPDDAPKMSSKSFKGDFIIKIDNQEVFIEVWSGFSVGHPGYADYFQKQKQKEEYWKIQDKHQYEFLGINNVDCHSVKKLDKIFEKYHLVLNSVSAPTVIVNPQSDVDRLFNDIDKMIEGNCGVYPPTTDIPSSITHRIQRILSGQQAVWDKLGYSAEQVNKLTSVRQKDTKRHKSKRKSLVQGAKVIKALPSNFNQPQYTAKAKELNCVLRPWLNDIFDNKFDTFIEFVRSNYTEGT